MSYRLMNVVAATATIAATPVLAQAQTVAYGTSSPVEIVAVGTSAHHVAWTGATNVDPGSITLRFVNRSAVPATSVTFVVNKGGDSRSIIDKGSFGPGTLIEETFDKYVGWSDFSTATWAVAEVNFADGTAWHAAHTVFVGLRATAIDSDRTADTLDRRRAELEKRRAELEQLNADVRRVVFRHLGTSI